jgi:hypothetical protein
LICGQLNGSSSFPVIIGFSNVNLEGFMGHAGSVYISWNNRGMSVFDWIAGVFLFWTLIMSASADERKKLSKPEDDQIAKGIEVMAKMRQASHGSDAWTQDMEDKYNRVLNLEAAKAFLFWVSPRSFIVSLVGAVITYYIGWSSLPGAIFGFVNSSPRCILNMIRAYHALFGSKSGQPVQ